MNVARQADVIVVVVGTNESTSREAWADNHLGDVADLSFLAAGRAGRRPCRPRASRSWSCCINGRPLAITRIAETVPAILEGFYLGQEGGTAMAEVLFGDVNPGGKLPITFPRSVGQLPVYYGRKPTSFRPYLDPTRDPLFAFGHGLSYTTFKLEGPEGGAGQDRPRGRGQRHAWRSSNTGTRRETRWCSSTSATACRSVTRPVKELRGFQRVTLAPGERRPCASSSGPTRCA